MAGKHESNPTPLTAQPPRGEREASSPSCRGRRREDGRVSSVERLLLRLLAGQGGGGKK